MVEDGSAGPDGGGSGPVLRNGAAAGADDRGERARAAWRRERRWMGWMLAVFVVIAAAGGASGTLASSGGGLDPHVLLVLGLVLLGVVVTVGVVFVFAYCRPRESSIFVSSPLWELPTQRQRSATLRDLRRGHPIAPEHRDLALRVARDWTRRRFLVWLYLGLAVINGFNAAIQDGWPRWTYLVSAVAFLGLAAWFVHVISRMRRAADRLDTDSPGDTAVEQRPAGGP